MRWYFPSFECCLQVHLYLFDVVCPGIHLFQSVVYTYTYLCYHGDVLSWYLPFFFIDLLSTSALIFFMQRVLIFHSFGLLFTLIYICGHGNVLCPVIFLFLLKFVVYKCTYLLMQCVLIFPSIDLLFTHTLIFVMQ